MTEPNIGQRIKEARERYGLSKEQLCASMSSPVTAWTLWRWEDGETNKIPFQAILDFARVHGISPGDYIQKELGIDLGIKPEIKRPEVAIVSTQKEAQEIIEAGKGNFVILPVLNEGAAGADPKDTYDLDDIADYAMIYKSWVVGSLKRYICLRVKDPSMHPILPEGSIVCVDKTQTDLSKLIGKGLRRIVAVRHLASYDIGWLEDIEEDQGIVLCREQPLPAIAYAKSEFMPFGDMHEDPIIGLVVWAWTKWEW